MRRMDRRGVSNMQRINSRMTRKGLPHYQTKGKTGHSFWGTISVADASLAGALNEVAEAAEYIPDAAPGPATQEDIDRTNKLINAISDYTGTPLPTYSDIPNDRTFPFPDPEKPDHQEGRLIRIH